MLWECDMPSDGWDSAADRAIWGTAPTVPDTESTVLCFFSEINRLAVVNPN